MNYNNILVLYKESNYKIRLSKASDQTKKEFSLLPNEKKRLIIEHKAHYVTLDVVNDTLKKLGLSYHTRSRGRKTDYSKADLVITVGGDGTFLQAARNVLEQPILGVNSAPDSSVGRFCPTNAKNFERYLKKMLKGSAKFKQVYKIQGVLRKERKKITAVNDFLIAHRNPSALSRYVIQQGRIKEVHKCSGLWIATAAGSTGAVCSAGGKKQSVSDKNYQYKPRELCAAHKAGFRLKGGLLKPNQEIRIVSLMRDARIYIDGAHKREKFIYGETITVRRSKEFINAYIV